MAHPVNIVIKDDQIWRCKRRNKLPIRVGQLVQIYNIEDDLHMLVWVLRNGSWPCWYIRTEELLSNFEFVADYMDKSGFKALLNSY